MTKKEIVKAISEEIDGLTQLQTKEIVQKTFDAIVHTLAAEGRVELRNFGVFEVKKRAARKARNPRTNERVEVAEKWVVTFKPGKEMKELVHLLAERREAKKAADSSRGAQAAASTNPPAAFPPSDAAIGATIPAPAPVGSQPPPAPSDPEIGRADSERFGSTDRYGGDAQYD